MFSSFHPYFEDTESDFLLAKQLEMLHMCNVKQTISIIIHGPGMIVMVMCGMYLNFKLNACYK